MLDKLEVRVPPEDGWVSLIAALTWIEFQHSLEIQELLERISAEERMENESIRLRLQETWRNLADQASQGRIEIRGRMVGDRVEERLGPEHFRNNRFLGWVKRPEAGVDVRVERHDGTYEGEWERLGDNRGYDYHQLVIRRDELLQLCPIPAASLYRRRGAGAKARSATDWLRVQFQGRAARSVPKKQLLLELHQNFNLTKSQGQLVWREAVVDYPEWSTPGRPRKSLH